MGKADCFNHFSAAQQRAQQLRQVPEEGGEIGVAFHPRRDGRVQAGQRAAGRRGAVGGDAGAAAHGAGSDLEAGPGAVGRGGRRDGHGAAALFHHNADPDGGGDFAAALAD